MVRQAEIEVQLRRILDSESFASSARSQQFLRFCVEMSAAGRGEELKETTIAVEVFQRSADYDPKSDPIVRVHARRVRDKLQEYYKVDGVADAIRIEIPKGGYVPRIERTLPMRKSDFSDWRTDEMIDPLAVEQSTVPLSIAGEKFSAFLRRRPWLIVAPAMMLMVLVTIVLLQLAQNKPHAQVLAAVVPRPFDTGFHHVWDPAWSGDGTRLAFAAAESAQGAPHIYLQQATGNGIPARLTHEDLSEFRPVWSPDGREIAFIRNRDSSHFEIVRMDLRSGAIRPVGDFPSNLYSAELHFALDWSPDGRYLLTAEQSSAEAPMHLVLIELSTGERRTLTTPPTSSTGDLEGKFSPDGQWVAFHRGGLGELYLISIRGEQAGPATRLTSDGIGVRGIAWCDRGQSILYSSRRETSGAYGLWKVSVHGGVSERIGPYDFDVIDPAVSPNGSILLRHREDVTNLVEYPLDPHTLPRNIAESSQIDQSPEYSPDGRHLAFVSTRSGSAEVWLDALDNSLPKQMTHFHNTGQIFMLTWSPDGSSIVFSYRRDSATNLYRFSLKDASVRQLTNSKHRSFSPVFSADGMFIYYSSNDDGNARVWRIRADGSSNPEPLFWEAVIGFLPSSDGKWMYFVQGSKNATLVRRNLQDGSTEEIFHAPGRVGFFKPIASAKGMIWFAVMDQNSSEAAIYQIDPERKSSRLVFHLKDLPVMEEAGFSVSPDGNHIAATKAQRHESGFYLLN